MIYCRYEVGFFIKDFIFIFIYELVLQWICMNFLMSLEMF